MTAQDTGERGPGTRLSSPQFCGQITFQSSQGMPTVTRNKGAIHDKQKRRESSEFRTEPKTEVAIVSSDSTPAKSGASRKRKRQTDIGDSSDVDVKPARKKKSKIPTRLKRWRKKIPQATQERMARVYAQRMYLLGRQRTGSLTETFDVLGSIGNVYTVTISDLPRCTCPDRGVR